MTNDDVDLRITKNMRCLQRRRYSSSKDVSTTLYWKEDVGPQFAGVYLLTSKQVEIDSEIFLRILPKTINEETFSNPTLFHSFIFSQNLTSNPYFLIPVSDSSEKNNARKYEGTSTSTGLAIFSSQQNLLVNTQHFEGKTLKHFLKKERLWEEPDRWQNRDPTAELSQTERKLFQAVTQFLNDKHHENLNNFLDSFLAEGGNINKGKPRSGLTVLQ